MNQRLAFGLPVAKSKIHGISHALREIVPGEQITTDYLYELNSEQITCSCRTAACDESTSLARIARSLRSRQARRPTAILAILRLFEKASLKVMEGR